MSASSTFAVLPTKLVSTDNYIDVLLSVLYFKEIGAQIYMTLFDLANLAQKCRILKVCRQPLRAEMWGNN